MGSFTDFVKTSMRERGWTNREFARQAGVSNRAIVEATSGKAEKLLASEATSVRKRAGIAASTQRILKSLGADVDEWMTRLKLDNVQLLSSTPKPQFRSGVKHHSLLLSEPLTSEDIEILRNARDVLGDLLSVEIALQLIEREHRGAS